MLRFFKLLLLTLSLLSVPQMVQASCLLKQLSRQIREASQSGTTFLSTQEYVKARPRLREITMRSIHLGEGPRIETLVDEALDSKVIVYRDELNRIFRI